MAELSTWLHEITGVAPPTQTRLAESVVVIVVLWLVRTVALRLVSHRTEDVSTRYHWRKGTNYAAVLVGLLLVGRIWFAGIQSLATFLGLVTAGSPSPCRTWCGASRAGSSFSGEGPCRWATGSRSAVTAGT